jgi:hypothetical protein
MRAYRKIDLDGDLWSGWPWRSRAEAGQSAIAPMIADSTVLAVDEE